MYSQAGPLVGEDGEDDGLAGLQGLRGLVDGVERRAAHTLPRRGEGLARRGPDEAGDAVEVERVMVADVVLDGEEPSRSARHARGGVPFDAERGKAELPRGYVPSSGAADDVGGVGFFAVRVRHSREVCATFRGCSRRKGAAP
jgi:hypothetical protein